MAFFSRFWRYRNCETATVSPAPAPAPPPSSRLRPHPPPAASFLFFRFLYYYFVLCFLRHRFFFNGLQWLIVGSLCCVCRCSLSRSRPAPFRTRLFVAARLPGSGSRFSFVSLLWPRVDCRKRKDGRTLKKVENEERRTENEDGDEGPTREEQRAKRPVDVDDVVDVGGGRRTKRNAERGRGISKSKTNDQDGLFVSRECVSPIEFFHTLSLSLSPSTLWNTKFSLNGVWQRFLYRRIARFRPHFSGRVSAVPSTANLHYIRLSRKVHLA